MKKLLFFAFFWLLFSKSVDAQVKTPVNSLSVVLAPNTFYQFPGKILDDTGHETKTGYTVGLDFAHSFRAHWHFKAGLRYNTWKSVSETGPLMWASEYSTGQYVYDPSLPHFFRTGNTDEAIQLLAGIGWHSKPTKWRWNADAELGATSPIRPLPGGGVVRLTVGLAFGPEWVINRHFHLFLQPGGRFIFKNLGTNDFAGYSFLSLQLETGVRYAF